MTCADTLPERMFCAQITRYHPEHFPATIHFWTNTRPTSNFLSQPFSALSRRRRAKKEKKNKNPATCEDAIGSGCSPSTISLFPAAPSCSALFSLRRQSIHFRSFNPEEEASPPGDRGDGRTMGAPQPPTRRVWRERQRLRVNFLAVICGAERRQRAAADESRARLQSLTSPTLIGWINVFLSPPA